MYAVEHNMHCKRLLSPTWSETPFNTGPGPSYFPKLARTKAVVNIFIAIPGNGPVLAPKFTLNNSPILVTSRGNISGNLEAYPNSLPIMNNTLGKNPINSTIIPMRAESMSSLPLHASQDYRIFILSRSQISLQSTCLIFRR